MNSDDIGWEWIGFIWLRMVTGGGINTPMNFRVKKAGNFLIS
jgi:hypothetical protein